MERESESKIVIAGFDSLMFKQLKEQFLALKGESKYRHEPITYIGDYQQRLLMFNNNVKYAITVFKNVVKYLNEEEKRTHLKLIEDIYMYFHWAFEDKAFAKTWNIFQDE